MVKRKLLFSDVYPYTPGKVDALVLISKKDLKIPNLAVILPPYPGADVFSEEDEFYRTTTVTADQLPQGLDAIEISTEAFLALNKPNPNSPPVRETAEVAKEMEKKELFKAPWSKRLIGGNGEETEEVDED